MGRRKEAHTVFAKEQPESLDQAVFILAKREPVARRLPHLRPDQVSLVDILPILNNYLTELDITTSEASLLVQLINDELRHLPYSDPNRARLVDLKVELSSRYEQRKRFMEHHPTGEEKTPPRPTLRSSRNPQ